VEQSSFDDYPLLRMDQCPKIVVTIISSDKKPAGVGEPGYPPVP
jgi:isoquinoline 1-oxidoreductase beta subunit